MTPTYRTAAAAIAGEGPHPCEHPGCDRQYHDRGLALRCCSERFRRGRPVLADGGRGLAPVAVDAHGCPMFGGVR